MPPVASTPSAPAALVENGVSSSQNLTAESPPSAPFTPSEYDVSFPENLPSEDNENMESAWHREQMELLINVIRTTWKGKKYFCGGNMFIHFSRQQVRNRDFRGPDFFVVLEVEDDRPRLYWAVWDEQGRYPNVIIELLSPTTAKEDLTTKKDIYERTFCTREYFCYDPDGEKLQGWRLDKRYRDIALVEGRLWSEELEMWLGPWKGTWDDQEATWLRFFDRDGQLLPTGEEKQARRANAAEAEIDLLRKELDALRHPAK
jgi:Uma2 family endonuclease